MHFVCNIRYLMTYFVKRWFPLTWLLSQHEENHIRYQIRLVLVICIRRNRRWFFSQRLRSHRNLCTVVVGMTCIACAWSIEKAIKRLPRICEAVVDVLNGRAQVIFFPNFINVILNNLFHFLKIKNYIYFLIFFYCFWT